MIYSGILLGPWGVLKDAAYHVGSSAWFMYAVIFLASIFVALPSLFALCVSRFDNFAAFKKRFATLSTALIPLGLMFWVAFSLSFVLTNASYILASLSDPLGLGWNLFGTANITWQPILTSILAPAQTLALVGGLIWSARTVQKLRATPKYLHCPSLSIALSLLQSCCGCFYETLGTSLTHFDNGRNHRGDWDAGLCLGAYAAYPCQSCGKRRVESQCYSGEGWRAVKVASHIGRCGSWIRCWSNGYGRGEC
jgi:hypothetical protein